MGLHSCISFEAVWGRGGGDSWCFLVASENERLRTLTHTNDGFEVARKDLEMRGPGELMGTKQHGVALLPTGVDLANTRLLEDAAECACLLATQPENQAFYKAVRERALELMGKAMQDVSVS